MNFNMNEMAGALKKMQDDMGRIQDELRQARLEGSDPSGKVRVVVTGHKEPVEARVDPSAIDPEDPGLLEDLILFAMRDALKKAEECSQEKMGSLTQGLPKVPGMKLPWE